MEYLSGYNFAHLWLENTSVRRNHCTADVGSSLDRAREANELRVIGSSPLSETFFETHRRKPALKRNRSTIRGEIVLKVVSLFGPLADFLYKKPSLNFELCLSQHRGYIYYPICCNVKVISSSGAC